MEVTVIKETFESKYQTLGEGIQVFRVTMGVVLVGFTHLEGQRGPPKIL